VGLGVGAAGLATAPVPLPARGAFGIEMDLRTHEILVRTSDAADQRIDMRAGASATDVGDALIAAARRHGLEGEYERERFESDEPRPYDPDAAHTLLETVLGAHLLLERHRATLGARVGPVLLWPHGFDLAFEWYGTRTVGGGEPAQLNLGLYPEGSPYFYSSPWPFDDALLEIPLPHGATWNTDGWLGAMLPYDAVAGDPRGAGRLAGFARAVFEAARPTLDLP
jgi:hypothetical protein